MQKFGQVFPVLQGKRHLADYDPDYRVGKLATPATIRRDFALHVLMKVRPDA